MQKKNLIQLALLGIGMGTIIQGCQKEDKALNRAALEKQMTPEIQSFYIALSADAQEKFLSLDHQHQWMAITMASQVCNGKNVCRSMGGCNTAQHACAGENLCKGQGGYPLNDPNKAVQVQYRNQERLKGPKDKP